VVAVVGWRGARWWRRGISMAGGAAVPIVFGPDAQSGSATSHGADRVEPADRRPAADQTDRPRSRKWSRGTPSRPRAV
jgi:hypothetical protein